MKDIYLKSGFFVKLIFICIIFTYTINYIVHYGFISNYSFNVYSEETFKKQYDNGIYRYRILGKILLLETFKIINKKPEIDKKQPDHILYLDKKGNGRFYKSYFLVNTFFNILTVTVFFLVLSNRKYFNLNDKQVILQTIIVSLLIGISQYVLTPYDALSNFLISISFPLILLILSSKKIIYFIHLLLTIILATLTRESSAIILSLFVVLILHLWKNKLISINKYLVFLFGCIFIYLVIYFSLRFYFGFENAFYQLDSVTYLYNFTNRKAQIGGIFLVSVLYILYIISETKTNKNLYLAFLFFCLPYFFTCWFTGLFFEIRLWVPVILPAIFLINLDPGKLLTKSNLNKIEN